MNIAKVKKAIELIKEFNKLSLVEVLTLLMEDGIIPSKKDIQQFEMTGLSNKDFLLIWVMKEDDIWQPVTKWNMSDVPIVIVK